jgi:hypothetical protein
VKLGGGDLVRVGATVNDNDDSREIVVDDDRWTAVVRTAGG